MRAALCDMGTKVLRNEEDLSLTDDSNDEESCLAEWTVFHRE